MCLFHLDERRSTIFSRISAGMALTFFAAAVLILRVQAPTGLSPDHFDFFRGLLFGIGFGAAISTVILRVRRSRFHAL